MMPPPVTLAKHPALARRHAFVVRLLRESARTSHTRTARIVRRRGGRDVLELWWRESSWDHRKRNGSHIGLGQMSSWASVHVRPSWNPHVQAEAFYRYVDLRYHGDPGSALAHLRRKGWH